MNRLDRIRLQLIDKLAGKDLGVALNLTIKGTITIDTDTPARITRCTFELPTAEGWQPNLSHMRINPTFGSAQ